MKVDFHGDPGSVGRPFDASLECGETHGGSGAPAVASRTAPPAEWTQDLPYVIDLVTALERDRDASGPTASKPVMAIYAHLLATARSDGVLAGCLGKHSRKLIGRHAGVSWYFLRDGAPARIVLERWRSAFLVGESGPHASTVPLEQRGVTARMRHYIAQTASTPGGTVPSGSHRNAISYVGVSDLTGMPYVAITTGEPAKLLRRAVRDGVVKLGPVYVPPAPLLTKERLEELRTVLRSFDVEGGKVPENPARKGSADFARMAELTGKPGPDGRESEAFRDEVREVARRRGTELPGVTATTDTFAALMVYGVKEVETEQKARGLSSWANGVSNHKSALERFCRELGLSTEDEVEEHFGEEFEMKVGQASAGLSTGSIGNFERSMAKWREQRAQRFELPDLSPHFGIALKQLAEHRDYNVAALARKLDCPSATLYGWMREEKGVSQAHVPLVCKIEKALRVPSGTLLAKVRFVRGRVDRIDGATEHYKALDYRIRRLLPYEVAFWQPKQLAAAVEKVKPLLGTGTHYGELCKLSQREENRLDPFRGTDQINRHLSDYVEYKTVPMPYPLLRSGHWATDYARDGAMAQLQKSFRFACTPAGDGPWSGLGLPAELQTLAWTAVAPIALAYPGQRAKRYADMEWKGDQRGTFYTDHETGYIDQLISLTNPDVGYLVQQPHLAETLVALSQPLPKQFDDLLQFHSREPGRPLLTEADVASARRDWTAWLTRTHKHYIQARGYVDTVAGVSRNPYESLAGLMLTAEPMAEYMTLLYESERHWNCQRTAVQSWRLDVRNAVMNRLAPLTGFRPKNLSHLTFTGDHRGQIRKVDGIWEIEVHYRLFKNWSNCRLFGTKTAPKNFKMQLRDECNLYKVLDTYFYEALPGLPSVPGVAFVSEDGRRMSQTTYATMLKTFGGRFIAYNPVTETGFPGVTSINPYQIRHLRASDTLVSSRAANRVEEAAFSIQTSEQMIINHYGFLIPEKAILQGYDTFSEGARRAWERVRLMPSA